MKNLVIFEVEETKIFERPLPDQVEVEQGS